MRGTTVTSEAAHRAPSMIFALGGAGPKSAWQRVEDAQFSSRRSRYELGGVQGSSTRKRSSVGAPERLRARVAHAKRTDELFTVSFHAVYKSSVQFNNTEY